MKAEFAITGMSCSMCVKAVENAVSALPGVKSVNVSLLDNSMTVEYDDKALKTEVIEKSVTDIGYGIKPSEGSTKKGEGTESEASKKRFILSVVVLLPLLYLNLSDMFSFPAPMNLSPYLQFGLSLAILVINRGFFVRGINSIKHKAPGMDALISLGAAAAFLFSTGRVIRNIVVTGSFLFTSVMNRTNVNSVGNVNECRYFFESAGMIFTLITLGKMLEAGSKKRTMEAIDKLSKLAPSTVTAYVRGKEIEASIHDVCVGDELVVKRGDILAFDGKVTFGSASLDTSAITGESIPRSAKEGDEVISGTACVEGSFRFEVTKIGKDTTLNRIIELVKTVGASKAPIQRLADKISGYFVPIVVAVALITFILWLVTGHLFSTAVEFAINVLVISCPCALGLATPTAIMTATGNAATRGILLRNAECLEYAKDIDAVLFDKTGTVTKGKITSENTVDRTTDSLREDSKEAVNELKRMGVKCALVTGDKDDIAKDISTELGIDDLRSEVLPEDKYKVVEEYRQKGFKVCMVGDGINDSPALVSANVGIAVSSGSDIAIDCADVILLKDSMKDVAYVINLSKVTMKVIKQNLFWALFYNCLAIPIAAGALYVPFRIGFSPALSAACMSLSSLFVVTNALRLRKPLQY